MYCSLSSAVLSQESFCLSKLRKGEKMFKMTKIKIKKETVHLKIWFFRREEHRLSVDELSTLVLFFTNTGWLLTLELLCHNWEN